ncbi:MAG: hypothetical protein AAGA86_07850, partial [Bacteroidota bacterium]
MTRSRLLGFYLFFSVFPVLAVGQDDYLKGYVITNVGDTLWGLVKDRKTSPPSKKYKKIYFKNSNKRRKKRFAPKDIKGYRAGPNSFESIWFKDAIDFFQQEIVSVPGQGKRVFLRVEEIGHVLYYVDERQEPGDEFVLEVDYFKKRDNPKMVRATQGLFGLKRKRLALFFADCPPLVEKIKKK